MISIDDKMMAVVLGTHHFCWDTKQHSERVKMTFTFSRIDDIFAGTPNSTVTRIISKTLKPTELIDTLCYK